MRIRADVQEMMSIARSVRAAGESLSMTSSRIRGNVQGLAWSGQAQQHFDVEYQKMMSRMSRTISQMQQFSQQLEQMAEAFRQADAQVEARS
ncbi:WXG100 family type VII secretion target [Paenibacillus pini]|uniref:ESAT-6-like protein n=1 Tax=Paenibacillus pini JCM 16418 TaxID=1236976 RepID=W7YZE2_9BACL|nr:WXG100 family type VII secretion target [Paenibacillus pini]GAF07734.1 hypothetical protein JCM16418_1762 [Paenibacillus pini JCM 16418]